MRIKKKKALGDGGVKTLSGSQREKVKPDAFYAGAFPGKPWERLTNIRHKRGKTVQILSPEEQAQVIDIARRYFSFEGSDFVSARIFIQREIDDVGSHNSDRFFKASAFAEKRLLIRAYLSDAEGRFVHPEIVLYLMKRFADAGLDFEVGAVNHFINKEKKSCLTIGDGREVISDEGYWFAHTHPVRQGITNNILPSLADIDVMLATAMSYAQNINLFETEYYVLRDIGASRIDVYTSKTGQPSSAKVENIRLSYYLEVDPDKSIDAHISKLVSHIRMRHRIHAGQISVECVRSWDDLIGPK